MSTCVLVADTSRARIFVTQTSSDPLIEIEELVHPESRLHPSELGTDEPGITFDRKGQGAHSMGQETDLKKQEALRFAKEVAQEVSRVKQKNPYNKLYIIAAPAFLGILRNTLSDTTKRLIAGEVNKNLTTFDVANIRSSLPRYL